MFQTGLRSGDKEFNTSGPLAILDSRELNFLSLILSRFTTEIKENPEHSYK